MSRSMIFHNRLEKISISNDQFDKIKKDKRFLQLLTLARVWNALRFCCYPALNSHNTDTPSARLIKINSFLFTCAVLYEGFLVVEQLRKHFHQLSSFKKGFASLSKDPEVKRLREDYLRPLRNKLVFHFDKDVPETNLDCFDLPEYNFATCIGPTMNELYFDLADEVAFNYLVPSKKKEANDELNKRHKRRFEEAGNVTNRFMKAAIALLEEAMPMILGEQS